MYVAVNIQYKRYPKLCDDQWRLFACVQSRPRNKTHMSRTYAEVSNPVPEEFLSKHNLTHLRVILAEL